MFSGIIQSQGKIKKLSREEKSLVVEIHSTLRGFKLGSSICCAGICLTVKSSNIDAITILLFFGVKLLSTISKSPDLMLESIIEFPLAFTIKVAA